MTNDDQEHQVDGVSQSVGDALNADIVVLSGDIFPAEDIKLNDLVRSRQDRRPNVLLMLSTFGGSADCAYRITRCLQECYKDGDLLVFVDSLCKSAGTLIAVGASMIIMSDNAELGPLDVQMKKPDEIDERASGLTPMQAMSTLRSEAYRSFCDFFINIRKDTRITSKTAADIASKLTVGLFGPIYEQIEPMRIGENERAMRVAEEYGDRLARKHRNLQPDALLSLITEYPSHEFVIDRSEASNLFKGIRSPDNTERNLAALIRPFAEEALFTERESLVHFFDSSNSNESTENKTTGPVLKGNHNGNPSSSEHLSPSSDSTDREDAKVERVSGEGEVQVGESQAVPEVHS